MFWYCSIILNWNVQCDDWRRQKFTKATELIWQKGRVEQQNDNAIAEKRIGIRNQSNLEQFKWKIKSLKRLNDAHKLHCWSAIYTITLVFDAKSSVVCNCFSLSVSLPFDSMIGLRVNAVMRIVKLQNAEWLYVANTFLSGAKNVESKVAIAIAIKIIYSLMHYVCFHYHCECVMHAIICFTGAAVYFL